MALTSSDLEAAAERVNRYWGAHLYVRVVPGSSPRMDWREVELPPEYAQWSHDRLMAILLHEWGHRMISPVSPERGALLRVVARRAASLSEQQAHTVVNIATDLWIDRFYLRSPDWSALYARGEAEGVAELAERTKESTAEPGNLPRPSLAHALLAVYSKLLNEADAPNVPEMPPDPERERIAQEVWTAAYGGTAQQAERVADLAHVLAPLLPEEPPNLWPLGLPLRFVARQGRRVLGTLLQEGRRAGLEEADFTEIFDADAAEALRRRTRRLRLYARIAPAVERFLGRRADRERMGYRPWHVGRPLRELDLLATLDRSARLLPGVTTLRPRYERRGHQRGQGGTPVVLVIDDSGSTTGPVLEREQEAAFAVIAAARRLGDPVGLVVFGSGVSTSLALTSQYHQLEDAVAGLRSESGGTDLVTGFRAAYDLVSEQPGATLFLMTDAEIIDARPVADFISTLPVSFRVVAFCFGDTDYIRESLGAAIGPRFEVHRAEEDVPFAEGALEECFPVH